jgi:KaiC/GvpD/RAD55 family RecA-like ATPase
MGASDMSDEVSELIELPPEIERFFSQELGSTLLIKGKPGTGKTIFALSLLKKMCEEGNGIYLSTRVDAMIIYKLFPWIKGTILDKSIVDAVRPRLSPVKGDKFQLARQIEYSDKPTFIRQLYNLTYELNRPFLVIDSWDAIEIFSKSKYGESIIEDMIEFARKTDVRIIFVTEYHEIQRVDYLIDAVIVMERDFLDGKSVRIMQIEKMRGVEISRGRYLYTLKDGIFRYLKPMKFSTRYFKRESSDLSAFEEIDEMGEFIKDNIPKLILVEYDVNTPQELPLCVLSPLMKKYSEKGKDVKIVRPAGIGVSSIKGTLGILPDEILRDEEMVKKIASKTFQEFKEVFFVVFPSEHEVIKELTSYSQLHLKFRTIDGTPLLRLIKPDSQIYHVEVDEREIKGFTKLV